MPDVTQILAAAAAGDAHAADALLPVVYDELRKLAAARLAAEKPGQTLQATALVHEAYLRLVGGEPRDWTGRGHFFAAAAEAMRRILVEQARRKGRVRHGGGRRRVELEDVPTVDPDARAGDLVALDEAVDALARVEPVKAEVVKLRYFAGLTIEETAACLGISSATAKRHWAVARAWLYHHLSAENESGDSARNP